MEYFRLDHPPDRLILCNRSNCDDIADYLEVNELDVRTSFALPTPAVKSMLQFCLRVYPLPIRAEADLLPDPRKHSDHK